MIKLIYNIHIAGTKTPVLQHLLLIVSYFLFVIVTRSALNYIATSFSPSWFCISKLFLRFQPLNLFLKISIVSSSKHTLSTLPVEGIIDLRIIIFFMHLFSLPSLFWCMVCIKFLSLCSPYFTIAMHQRNFIENLF